MTRHWDRGTAWARPKIIYFINTYDNGGAELGLLKLVEGGMFEGTDLTVVALVRGSGVVRDRLTELDCKAAFMIDRPRMRLKDLPVAYWSFRRLVENIAPDFVIASLPQANIIARLAVYFRRGITFVSFEHNTHLAKPVYEILYRLTSSRVDWIFADAAVTLNVAIERLYRKHPDPVRQFVVPLVEFNSPACGAPSPRPRDGAPFHVVNAARMTDTKNQGEIIRAVARLRKQGLSVRLTLYGDGPNRSAYQALCRELQIAAHVSMPGFVGDWASHPADAFVLSSQHEGLCIVLLEAMHAGIPVIAPLVGGIRDYGGPEVMEVVPEVTPEALARAVAQIADVPDQTAQKVARAAKMVDARFGTAPVRASYRALSVRFSEDASLPGRLECTGASSRAQRDGG
jgi:glycosyltransferase involved in cell wall biosynthesis